MKNCPNCGAVIDTNANKCAFCGTSYYDLSCIPLGEPFFLRLNVGTKENPQIIMQKVYTTGATITRSPDYCTSMTMDGRIARSVVANVNTEYELTFVGLNGAYLIE